MSLDPEDWIGNQQVVRRVAVAVIDDQLAPSENDAPSGARVDTDVVVYWRPGCPFCAMLRAGLRLKGVAFREVNIWHDPDAAAFVRSVARGNETVPTVSIGAVALVNPSAREVAALVAADRP